MKLYSTITSRKGKRLGIGDNQEIITELSFKNKLIGRVVMKDDEVNPFEIYFYPITENTGKGGRILLHKE